MNTTETHKKNQERNAFFSENISVSRSFLIALGYPARLRDFVFLLLQSSQGRESFQITLQELSELSFRKDFLEREKRGLFEPYSIQAIRRAIESFEVYQESQGIHLMRWIPSGKFSRMEVYLWSHFNEIHRRLQENFERVPKSAYKEECERYADELLKEAIPCPITRDEKKEKRNKEILDSIEKQVKKTMSKEKIVKKIEFASEMENRYRAVRLQLEKMLSTGNFADILVNGKSATKEEDQHGKKSGVLRADLEGKKDEKILDDTRIKLPIRSDRDEYTGIVSIKEDDKKSYSEKIEDKKEGLRAKEYLYGIKNNSIFEAKKQVENFEKMGAKKFSLVYWDQKTGKTVWYPEVTKEDLFLDLDQILCQRKPILTPKSSLPIIKLDDVNEELLKKLNRVAFQVLETSKGSFHVWLAFQDKVDIKDIRYRIVKKLGNPLDLTDSGESSRLVGSSRPTGLDHVEEISGKKENDWVVKLKKANNYMTSELELISLGILDKKEDKPFFSRAVLLDNGRTLPSFAEFQARCPEKRNGESDVSRAIYRWTLRALELGFSREEILPELERLCGHKKKRDQKVAEITLKNAIKRMKTLGKVIVCQ